MNKIILQFGLLVFCLMIVFFSQREMSFEEILLKSFIIFVALMIMLSITTLLFLRYSNKNPLTKSKPNEKS